jgi:hypothetical protein
MNLRKEHAMDKSGLHTFVNKLATDLGVPGAARDVLTLLRLSGMEALLGRPTGYSDVAPGPLPLEISFSQACERDLRFLVEPCLSGEGILARTVMSLNAIRDVTEGLFSSEIAQQSYNLACHLLPYGEFIAQLPWSSSIWLALRATESSPTLRIYVNANHRGADDRWMHFRRGLSACGLGKYSKVLALMSEKVKDLIIPIGLSFDIRESGITPARVHCATNQISPDWMQRLLAAANHEDAFGATSDFMDIFGLLEHQGPCPFLVSLGLGQSEAETVKIDVDLPNLDLIFPGRQTDYLANVEARFGKIAGYHNVKGAFGNTQPRYIGITIAKNVQYINIYFPYSFEPKHPKAYITEDAFKKAHNFVRGQLESKGALLMDARSSCPVVRAVPDGWPDIYMTCLLIQEHSPALELQSDLLERIRSYILSAREGSYWRYFPNLPCDLDDSAMGWLALDPAISGINAETLTAVIAMANSDGGFPTFIGDQFHKQLSHPAVTLNITLALDRANIDWSFAESDKYLERILQQPNFPVCEWIGSPIFPIFLFARSTDLMKRLGESARERLVSSILRMHRPDGMWGIGLPDGLDTALAVISLDLLGAEIPRAKEIRRLLLTLQLDDGGWGWSPLFSDGTGTWFGHRAITTAMVIRALEILDSGKQPCSHSLALEAQYAE